MELPTRFARFLLQLFVVFAGCVAVSAVIGLALEAINWIGSESGLWDLIHSFFMAIGDAPGAARVEAFVEKTGASPAWLGYLLAMAVLAQLGLFRSRK